MKLAIKIAATIAVLGVIGLTLAAGSDNTDAAACNAGVKTTGRLEPGALVTFDAKFCSDPSDSLVGMVTWGNKISADKNLAVVVTAPSGMAFYFDNPYASAAQSFVVYGPLEEGDWTIAVVNTGLRRLSYDLQFGFG